MCKGHAHSASYEVWLCNKQVADKQNHRLEQRSTILNMLSNFGGTNTYTIINIHNHNVFFLYYPEAHAQVARRQQTSCIHLTHFRTHLFIAIRALTASAPCV